MVVVDVLFEAISDEEFDSLETLDTVWLGILYGNTTSLQACEASADGGGEAANSARSSED